MEMPEALRLCLKSGIDQAEVRLEYLVNNNYRENIMQGKVS